MRKSVLVTGCAAAFITVLGLVYVFSSGAQADSQGSVGDSAITSSQTAEVPVRLRLLTGAFAEGAQTEVALVNLETAEPIFSSGDDIGLILAASVEAQGQVLVSTAVANSEIGALASDGYSVRLLSDDFGGSDFELFYNLDEGRHPPRAFLTPDGDQIWVVTNNGATQTAVLRELSSGLQVASIIIPNSAEPEGATEDGLIVASHHDETDTAPEGGASVNLVGSDGSLQPLGVGEVLAVTDNGVLLVSCQQNTQECTLSLGGEETLFDLPEGGQWTSPGRHAIPTLSRGLSAVSPDGSSVLISQQNNGDGHNTPSTLYRVDLAAGELTEIASQSDRFQLTTWSTDGNFIVTVDGSDVVFYDSLTPDNSFTLPDVIPEGHHVLAAG